LAPNRNVSVGGDSFDPQRIEIHLIGKSLETGSNIKRWKTEMFHVLGGRAESTSGSGGVPDRPAIYFIPKIRVASLKVLIPSCGKCDAT
jgi:hypothetical protein